MASAKTQNEEEETKEPAAQTLSLKDKIAASKKEDLSKAVIPTETPDISVASLAKLFGFNTATA